MNESTLEKPDLESEDYYPYLEKLRKKFLTPKTTQNINHEIEHPIGVFSGLMRFDRHYGCRDNRGLDLGCANGFQLAAYSREGWQMYGIERDFEIIEEARGILKGLEVEAHIFHGDYYEGLGNVVFEDGIRIPDIDFFICYTYDAEHWWKVYLKVLCNPLVKQGAVCYMDYIGGRKNGKELFTRGGYDMVKIKTSERGSEWLWIKKRKSELSKQEIEEVIGGAKPWD